jgi:hypothetical protein
MKKLFPFVVVLLLSSVFVSCTKSVDSNVTKKSSKMGVSRDISQSEDNWAKFYNAVEQPRPTPLGDPAAGSVFFQDDQAVFFVIISPDVENDTYYGTLGISDDATGNVIQNYTLLPMWDPAAAGISIPAEIANSGNPYMFAVVDLDSRYTNLNCSMSATVQLPSGETANASLPGAFTVVP